MGSSPKIKNKKMTSAREVMFFVAQPGLENCKAIIVRNVVEIRTWVRVGMSKKKEVTCCLWPLSSSWIRVRIIERVRTAISVLCTLYRGQHNLSWRVRINALNAPKSDCSPHSVRDTHTLVYTLLSIVHMTNKCIGQKRQISLPLTMSIHLQSRDRIVKD